MIPFLIFLLFILAFLARYNFFRPTKKGILVLLYHRIDDKKTHTPLDKFSISLTKFEKQILYLKKKSFESILPTQIDEIVKNKSYLNKRYVLITFDDGYKDNLAAARVLKKHGFKAIFFIAAAHIGKTLDDVEMLDEADIKELVNMGMVIGSHSYKHINLLKLSRDEAYNQIKKSIDILSKFYPVEDIAYPFGGYDSWLDEILRDLNLKRGYIIGQRIFQPEVDSEFKIPRAIVRKDTDEIDFYLIITRGRSKF